MTPLLQISVNISTFRLETLQNYSTYKKPINCCSLSRAKIASLHHNRFKLRVYRERWSFLGGSRGQDGILVREEGLKMKKRVVLVRFNQGFGFNGGGGGGRDDGATARILGNLALAVGLTYLSMTGQLGWVLDAIVSVWLFVVLLPIVGLGAFLWWAGRDMVQGTCPNCGNDFQVFKSSLKYDLQLCPFCSQPFSVVGDEFVRDSVKFSNESTTFGQAFKDFSSSKKGKGSSMAVVDVEAEVKDAD
ncbi:uncharacterized protein LOC122281978 [Carya illinoinensis]|uniref:Uncharacterized protein n=1 Tax=Carya illinoinensis TaxID=32201 RepID=A0A8T1NYV7_CARIL|nr:uncharacterized protein LOC122281978 [Carya illinoinensis]KAG6637396.1 hypothetical protein CIPAW_11G175500 [Carya illinoinensis]KAG6689398.1 hypothetical protein I3842_11G172700 [Carya illinoinensis]